MARVMERSIGALVTGGFVTLATPAVGTKVEVLHVACSNYSGIAATFKPADLIAGVFWLYLDEFGHAAGVNASQRSYQSILIPYGESFGVGTVAAAPVNGYAYCTYMVVDL